MSSPYKTCALCGESFPITEMRAIRESFVTGQTSGHMHIGSSAGTSTSMGAGPGPRHSSSRRNSTGYTSGTTRLRLAERFYCLVNGCYERRSGQIRRAAARARAFRLLLLLTLLLGGVYIAYRNGALSGLIDQVTGSMKPQAAEPPPQPHHHHLERAEVAAASGSEPDEETSGSQVPSSSQAGVDSAATSEVGPPNEQALADAIDHALTSGEVVRWHDADRGLSGEVSVSASQAYADRECRSYRYTVRSDQGVVTSPGDVGCSVAGGIWSYRFRPR